MRCIHCNQILPDDSTFCQYCGSKVDVEVFPAQTSVKGSFCKNCGSLVDEKTKKCTGCSKQYFNAKRSIPLIALSVILIASVFLNVFLYRQNISLSTQAEQLEERVDSTSAELAEQKDLAASFKKKAQYYDDILKALRTGSIGRASASFSASDSVILINKDTVGRKFTLNTTWREGGGTIAVNHSGTSAAVSFDNSTWYDSTTLTVIPKHEGITAVTFSNDLNPDTFTIMIIVVP